MNELEMWIGDFLRDEECKIVVRKAGTYRFPNTYIYQMHRHIEYEVNYIASGKGVMTFDDKHVILSAGECIIIPPYIHHGFLVDTKSGCKICQAEMSVQISDQVSKCFPLFEKTQSYYKIKDCENIVPLIEQIARLFRKEENPYHTALIDLAVLQLLVALWHYRGKEDLVEDGSNKKMISIMRYLQEHYNESVSIEGLAEKWRVSSRYIRKYFEQKIGMSCMEYITVMRMNRAKELLWESTKSITEVALETGYGTSQYFSRIFKKEVGMTPSEYRSTWKEERALSF